MKFRDNAEVCIVDDDASDAEMSRKAISKVVPGVTVHVFSDGQALLARFVARGVSETLSAALLRPCLILLDLNMPGLNGFEVLRKLRAEEMTRSTPVVVFSSSEAQEDIAASIALGANSYVVKPSRAADYDNALAVLGRYWLTLNEHAAFKTAVNVGSSNIR